MKLLVSTLIIASLSFCSTGCGFLLCSGSCNLLGDGCGADFETDAAVLRSQAVNRICNPDYFTVIAGECTDGTRFLSRGSGFSGGVQFYSGTTGEFVGLKTYTDVAFPPCYGATSVGKVDCSGGTVTEVICGERFVVGDEFDP